MSTIERGRCSVFFAFDVGRAIDLDVAEQVLTVATTRELLRHRRRNPSWFQYRPPPLRVTMSCAPIRGVHFATGPTIECVLYDFGAVSLEFSWPIDGPIEALVALSAELEDNLRLEQEARAQVRELVGVVRTAIHHERVDDLVESYVVLTIHALAGGSSARALLTDRRAFLAQVLRAEQSPLSDQEIENALACVVSYGPRDLAVIDWNGAIVFDAEPDDTVSLLEFANVQLLEMRFLDNTLDDSLDRAHALLSRGGRRRTLLLGRDLADMRRVARLQADAAILFESVTNSLKLVGDAFLARFFQAVSERLHLADWQRSITRKLNVLESIYDKLADRQSSLRMELLEWIIIVLIAVSIVLPFVVGGAK